MRGGQGFVQSTGRPIGGDKAANFRLRPLYG